MEDYSFDEQAAELIVRLNRVHSSLGTLASPVAREGTALGYGWWSRVVRSAEAMRLLHSHALSTEASPVLRSLLHHTVALAWLREDPVAVLEAVKYDGHRRQQRLYQKAMARKWRLQGVKLGPPPRGKRPAGIACLDRFEDLCDVVGSPNLYVAYMIESGGVHPSGTSADVYLTERVGKVEHSPIPMRPGVPLRIAAAFAGTATNEFGELVCDDRLIEFAAETGATLGMGPELS